MNTKFPHVYFLTPITLEENENTEDYYALHDGQGNLYSPQDYLELIEKIKPFYELQNANELIEEHNKFSYVRTKLQNHSQNYGVEMSNFENGVFDLPIATFKFKKFKTDKRHWSCKCEWCGRKISSKTDKGYYLLSNSIFKVNERACT